MIKVLLSTNNPGKLLEMQSLLQRVNIQLLTPADVNLQLDVVEDGQTYAENALLKALAFSQASGLITLADDSGLEVQALSGAPGLYSARYSPKINANDKDRRDYLLAQLQGVPRPWTARFRATIAIVMPGGDVPQLTEGVCTGEIIPEERGDSGFGYDPIFLVAGLNRTMAELSTEEKNRLSHRALAIQAAIPFLEKLSASKK